MRHMANLSGFGHTVDEINHVCIQLNLSQYYTTSFILYIILLFCCLI